MIQVSGQDFGKILQIFRIYFLKNSVVGDNIIGELKFFHKYPGLGDAKMMTASEFVNLVLDKVLNSTSPRSPCMPMSLASARPSYPQLLPGGCEIDAIDCLDLPFTRFSAIHAMPEEIKLLGAESLPILRVLASSWRPLAWSVPRPAAWQFPARSR